MLNNKKVLVTGGTGAVGEVIVRKLVRENAKVLFTYRSHEEKAKALSEETGAVAYKLDLLDNAAVKNMARDIDKNFGALDGLVNNAGMTRIVPFALMEEADWDESMNGNLKTMFLVTHAVLRGMIRQKSGSIVNMGSIAGHRLLEVPVHYATAKAGVTGFTLSLARELSRYNIRVNEIVPGMLNGGVGKMVPDAEMEEYLSYCQAHRPGEPSEVAELVAFLLSDKSSYINAQSINIDGGI
jgi:3-oxoacyl-[acyl-carrier protein] reductase